MIIIVRPNLGVNYLASKPACWAKIWLVSEFDCTAREGERERSGRWPSVAVLLEGSLAGHFNISQVIHFFSLCVSVSLSVRLSV